MLAKAANATPTTDLKQSNPTRGLPALVQALQALQALQQQVDRELGDLKAEIRRLKEGAAAVHGVAILISVPSRPSVRPPQH